MYSQILYEVADPIATITLNRPAQLNAWTGHMDAELRHAMAAAETDKSVVAIVLTGAGRGFCSGADMGRLQGIAGGSREERPPAELAADPGDPAADPSLRGRLSYLLSLRKPVIAAINGPCAGIGVPLALCCDLRFASERAIFTTAFARRGLIAEWGLSWLLPRLVGSAHAFDLILSARRVEAAEAGRIGLVNRVLPHDELLSAVRSYGEELAASCSPTSLRIMKRQIYTDLLRPLGDAMDDAIQLMHESLTRADFREGVSSFVEKRPPKFERV